jgi:outer membrane biosynthesis protein TonB
MQLLLAGPRSTRQKAIRAAQLACDAARGDDPAKWGSAISTLRAVTMDPSQLDSGSLRLSLGGGPLPSLSPPAKPLRWLAERKFWLAGGAALVLLSGVLFASLGSKPAAEVPPVSAQAPRVTPPAERPAPPPSPPPAPAPVATVEAVEAAEAAELESEPEPVRERRDTTSKRVARRGAAAPARPASATSKAEAQAQPGATSEGTRGAAQPSGGNAWDPSNFGGRF